VLHFCSMAEETEQIKSLIRKEMQAWAVQWSIQRRNALRAQKIDAGGQLSRSIEFEIMRQSVAEAVELQIAFETYGRYIDIKKLKTADGGKEYIAGVEDWIKKRGFEQKFINAFVKNRKLKRIPETALNQIAWGIVKKRVTGKYRRRAWYNKAKTAAISDLYNTVAAALPLTVGESIKESFKPSSNVS
jgi:hypothetical protein